jgi:hypothetical protein
LIDILSRFGGLVVQVGSLTLFYINITSRTTIWRSQMVSLLVKPIPIYESIPIYEPIPAHESIPVHESILVHDINLYQNILLLK